MLSSCLLICGKINEKITKGLLDAIIDMNDETKILI